MTKMKYKVHFKPKAMKDLKDIQPKQVQKISDKIDLMSNNLTGDVKRLTAHSPEYRLRVGDYRVLFEVEQEKIIIYRIIHRRKAYK
jgi:mRNA interferase RelE/StbE